MRAWTRFLALLAACYAISGCGGATSLPSENALALSQPAIVPSASSTPVDDWVTYAHDYTRSAYQAQQTGISTSSVSSLTLRWAYHANAPISASPIAAGGMVYVVDTTGNVRALDARTGNVVWQTALSGSIEMTPTLADGMLFVGTHTTPSVFAALNAQSGAVIWQTALPGPIRGEPVVANGMVFEGDAGGDPPTCNHGGLRAFNELTGSIAWTWYVSPQTSNGGSVWSPIAFDGQNLYFGTGNTCSTTANTADAFVKLSVAGSLLWTFSPVNSDADDDFGGGSLLNDGSLVVSNKNGMLYALSGSNGKTIWSRQTGSIEGYGGIGTPTTDGHTLLVSAGYLSDPTKNADPGGMLLGLDSRGNQRWSIRTQSSIPGYAAIVNGIAFVDLDDTLSAVAVSTGALLWSYTTPSAFYASPAVVPSGVYTVDTDGNVYAFGLAGQPHSTLASGTPMGRNRIDHDAVQRAVKCRTSSR